MYRVCAACVLSLCVTSVSRALTEREPGRNAAQIQATPAATRFRCSPAVVGPDGEVTLTLTLPHGRELGVRTPDNDFLFIAFDPQKGNPTPPIDSRTFEKMRSLKLPVADVKGMELTSSGLRPIFTTPGPYRFIISHNLETEDDLGLNRSCTVGFAKSSSKMPNVNTVPPRFDSCLRGGAKLVGSQPLQVGSKLRAPKKTHHVPTQFPELPPGTSVGGVWVGEMLVDQHGKIAQVWTVRPLIVQPALPPINNAIVAAIRQWEFEPTVVEKVAIPVCMTVTVNINLQ